MTKKQTKTPMSFKPEGDVETRLRKISEATGLSLSYVVNAALRQGIPIVDAKLSELHKPHELKPAA
jgi:predicted transcriptional regulator